MRNLSIAMIGLALLAAGCAGDMQRSAAPSAQSGAMTSPSPMAQGDVIDRYAAQYEQRQTQGRRP